MDERRTEQRVEGDRAAVMVQLREARVGAPEVSKVYLCRTRDFSPSGLRLVVDHDYGVGTALRVVVISQHPPGRFTHLARVGWVGESEGPGVHWMGLALEPSAPEDDASWRAFLEALPCSEGESK